MNRFVGLAAYSALLCSLAGTSPAQVLGFQREASSSLDKMDRKLASTELVTGLLSDRALAFNIKSEKLYATDPTRGLVTVINGKTRARSTIKVGVEPVALAVNTVTNRVYVANNGSASVSVLDGETDTVIATLSVGKTPYVLAANEATNKIYVSNTFSNVITIIEGTSNEIHQIKVGSANEILVDSTRNLIYLLGYEDDFLTVLNGTTEAVSHRPLGALHLWDMALDEDLGEAYVTRIGSGKIVATGLGTDKPIVIPVGATPCALGIDAKRKLLYVANYASNDVTIIDTAKHIALKTVPVQIHPQATLVDEEADLVFVANGHSDSVSVIDGASRQVVATLSAGKNPYALALDADHGKLYTEGLGLERVTEIDITILRAQAILRK